MLDSTDTNQTYSWSTICDKKSSCGAICIRCLIFANSPAKLAKNVTDFRDGETRYPRDIESQKNGILVALGHVTFSMIQFFCQLAAEWFPPIFLRSRKPSAIVHTLQIDMIWLCVLTLRKTIRMQLRQYNVVFEIGENWQKYWMRSSANLSIEQNWCLYA